MRRSTLEVADIVRTSGDRFWEHYGSHLAWQHRKVLDAIVRCRTAALGGHRDQCDRCGHQASLTTHAETGTAPDVRGTRAPDGSTSAGLSCCPSITFTSSSRCRTNSPPRPEEQTCYTICCSEQCSDGLDSGDETSCCVHRVSWRAAHLGAEPSPSSAHALRRSGWRSCTRRFTMDRLLETILPARRRAESRLPRQVRSRTETTLSSAQAPVSRLTAESC